ncbi:MAG TPA: phosphatase PAP2 family protein, partial [Longimicrobiales bacterium]
MREFRVVLLTLTVMCAPAALFAQARPAPTFGPPLAPPAVGAAAMATTGVAAAEAATQAASPASPPFFTYRDALLLAAFGAASVAMDPLDRHFAAQLQDSTNQNNHFLHKTATFFRLMGQPGPQIIGVGLYGVGRLTKNEKIEKLAVHGMEAMLLSTAATTTIKVMAGRARPRRDTTKALGFKLFRGLPGFLGGKGTEFQSFPSGHATTAFAVASAATAEWSHWVDQ